ncbi:uncharacterized protein LOC128985344 [Macrosteles quadrilineatus]|uniref:uncharacterized protein LOC128985344 n=1 Tax=Macrosteles quadrilineatus TaxID=74068 RepID=UPI0023E285C9|nr:uncharacterized protein LOC128985344 [Macrosteles quadrilineatus]
MASMNEIEVSQTLLQRARLISRAAWGAQLPKGKNDKLDGIISHIIFTYTDKEPCNTREECVEAVRTMQQYHMDQGKFDIPYRGIREGL